MFKRHFAVLLLLCSYPCAFAAPASAPSAPPSKYGACSTAAGYAAATAGEPQFADKAIWPISGKERFLKQEWTKGRVLVWARPGESADVKDRRSKLDAYDTANWIDAATRKPPASLLDAETDIVLPASTTPYTVSFKKGDQEHAPVTLRHLTVQPGAGWYSAGLLAHGNIWIKSGGRIGNHGSLALVGGKHTFFRNDNGDTSSAQRGDGSEVSQYITFSKEQDISAEMLGAFSTGDEFRVIKGTLIIGPDSRVRPGRNATPYINKEATLAVLDGSRFGKWCNQICAIDLIVMGTLQGGLPERPLKREAYVGISYQNSNGTKFYDTDALKPPAQNRSLELRVAPLLLADGSRIKTYSEDLNKACLTIGWVGLDAKLWHANPQDVGFKRMEPAAQKHLTQQLDKLPKFVTAAFAGSVDVDGVRFDRFAKGGLVLAKGVDRSGWKNVLFGRENEGTEKELFRTVSSVNIKAGTYED
jgi:hypothetical protein